MDNGRGVAPNPQTGGDGRKRRRARVEGRRSARQCGKGAEGSAPEAKFEGGLCVEGAGCGMYAAAQEDMENSTLGY